MRRLFYRTFTAVFTAAAMFAVTTPSLAQSDAVDMGHIIEDGAEVRAGAGSSYYLVGRLKKGTIVNIDDRFFEWYKITPPPTVHSYVKKLYVTPGAEKGTGTINRNRAPVFAAAVSGPGESYRRQVDLHKGDAVKIEAEEGDYYKVRSPRHAYVYVRVTAVKRAEFIPADITAAAVTPPSPTPPAPAATSTTAVAPEPTPITTTVVTKVVEPTPTPETTPEATPETTPKVTAEVTAESTPTVAATVTAAQESTMPEASTGAGENIVTATSETTKAVVDTTVKAADATVKTGADAIDTATASKAGTTTREVTQSAVDKTVDATKAVATGTGQATVKAGTATVDTTKAVVTTTATKTGEAVDAAASSKVATTAGGAVKTATTTTVDATKTAAEGTADATMTVADRTRTVAADAADAASRAMNATVRGAGAVVAKTGEAVTSAAIATREFIDPTPEPIVSPTPVRVEPVTVAPMPTTTTRATVSTDPPPRVSYTPTGDIRIPPLTEGRMVTASSDGTTTKGPAPEQVVIEPSRLVTSATPTIETPKPAPVIMGPVATVEPTTETAAASETTTTTQTTATTTASDPMPTDLAGLEAQLVAAEKLPLEQQPLDALLAGYESLYAQPGSPPEDRRVVLQRIIKLRRNIALAATLREIGQMQQTLSSAPPVTATQIAAPVGPRAPEYSAVGQLLASGVYDGVNMPRLYRIVSPRMRTIAYVRPTSTLDAVAMLGKIVGVEGETRYDQSLKLQVMEPTSIVVLSPEAATVLP